MDALFRLEEASVAEIVDAVDDRPSYNSVRVILRILEDKKLVAHRRDGQRYIYRPRQSRDQARSTALRHLVETFFKGSTPQAVAALIDESSSNLSSRELDELATMLDRASAGRKKT